MSMIETKVLRESWDVDRRLSEMGLSRATLLEVRDVALASSANATPFHPVNAPGTFAYQDGTWALRDRHVGEGWSVDRSSSVEAIKNDELKLRLIFCNVDVSCNDDLKPKPRSRKGSGSERACQGNDLFGGSLPDYAPRQPDGIATYYLMVSENGAAELTRVVIKGGTFSTYVERIYLSNGDDFDADKLIVDDGDIADNFDPLVARK